MLELNSLILVLSEILRALHMAPIMPNASLACLFSSLHLLLIRRHSLPYFPGK